MGSNRCSRTERRPEWLAHYALFDTQARPVTSHKKYINTDAPQQQQRHLVNKAATRNRPYPTAYSTQSRPLKINNLFTRKEYKSSVGYQALVVEVYMFKLIIVSPLLWRRLALNERGSPAKPRASAS